MIIKHGRHIFFGEIHEVRKGLWAFFSIVLFVPWLAGQAITWVLYSLITHFGIEWVQLEHATNRNFRKKCDYAGDLHNYFLINYFI